MKIRKIGIAALSLATMLTLASCGGSRSNILMNDENLPEIKDDGKDYIERLSSSNVDFSNAKKVFYIGDEFSTEGLKVTLNYRKVNKTTGATMDDIVTRETDQYSVNTKQVNLSKVGKYPVVISVRVGTKIEETTYMIEVKSSLLESTPGTVYIGGIDLVFKNTQQNYVEKTLDSTYNITKDDLEYKIHKRTVTNEIADGKYVIKDEILSQSDIDESKIKFDFSSIVYAEKAGSKTYDKVGNYLITMSYDNGNVSVGNETYHNDVTSYVIVDVTNHVTKLTIENKNVDTFEASVEGIDLSVWKIRIQRQVREDEIINYSDDLFDMSVVDEFLWGSAQTITINLKEEPSIKLKQPIIIEESRKYDIKKYVDFKKPDSATDGRFYLAGTDFISVADSENVKFEDRSNKSGNKTSDKKYYTDNYGSLFFPVQVKLEKAEPIKVVMNKPGKIVLFFASASMDDELEVYMKNEAEEELAVATTIPTKQALTKHIFEVQAGTYYFSSSVGNIYVHGMVIAKNKK